MSVLYPEVIFGKTERIESLETNR